MFGIKTRLKKFLGTRKTLLHNYKILREDFAQQKCLETGSCVDAAGDPVPWITFPAIEYIKQLDLSHARVLEYGSGFSTHFWAKRVKHVTSIEDDKSWYERMSRKMPKTVDYRLCPDEETYVNEVKKLDGKFDIIVNDGIHRFRCGQASRDRLKDGGFIILDNSDWCAKTAAYYRDSDLIEVDMHGFCPLNQYTMTTSFFLTRSFKPKPAHDHMPTYGPGAEHVDPKELEEWVRG
ncbi:MAG: SAM-dependent methyltransferase [Phycisphaerae bacterium]|nr:hypothetical protein [Tepidisphaeraceae bacterium]